MPSRPTEMSAPWFAQLRPAPPSAVRCADTTHLLCVRVLDSTGAFDDCQIVYQEFALHKGDVFTKHLLPGMFKTAIERLSFKSSTASGRAGPASRYAPAVRNPPTTPLTQAPPEQPGLPATQMCRPCGPQQALSDLPILSNPPISYDPPAQSDSQTPCVS